MRRPVIHHIHDGRADRQSPNSIGIWQPPASTVARFHTLLTHEHPAITQAASLRDVRPRHPSARPGQGRRPRLPRPLPPPPPSPPRTPHPPHRLRPPAMSPPPPHLRALAKVGGLDCDAVIFDLEDAVAPGMKAPARGNLVQALANGRPERKEIVVGVNAIDSSDFEKDMETVALCRPDAVLVPKIHAASDVRAMAEAMARHRLGGPLRLWLMVETLAALQTLGDIVQAGLAAQPVLDCLVVGTNDLAKESGVFAGDQRH